MKTSITLIGILLFTIPIQLISQHVFVSDSITYRYAGEATPERAKSYLRQFGCIDQTTEKTKIVKDGEFIAIVTELEREGRYKVVNITRSSQTELKTVQKENYIEKYQSIYGDMQGSVYFKELDYYNPINSVESPYVLVNWIERNFDDDEVFERLEMHLVNSKDIIQVFHCHIDE